MMLSLSGSADLGTREPTLRSLVLGGEAAPLPEGMRLFIALCAGPRARFAGGPWGMPIHDTSTGVWTWVLGGSIAANGGATDPGRRCRPWIRGGHH